MDGVVEEQAFVDSAYARLTVVLDHVRTRMDDISRSPGTGTGLAATAGGSSRSAAGSDSSKFIVIARPIQLGRAMLRAQ